MMPPSPPGGVSRIDGAARPEDNAPGDQPRARFDSLFADARHFRGDCRLVRTAIRRGRLDDLPGAERAALLARFEAAAMSREGQGFASEGARVRALLASVGVALDVEGADLQDSRAALRAAFTGEYRTGRPRERWRVSDHPARLDANRLRREAIEEGRDLRTLGGVELRRAGAPGERVGVAVVADAFYGWRVWLLCPRCQRRRVHLYPTRRGVLCRACAGVGYSYRKAC